MGFALAQPTLLAYGYHTGTALTGTSRLMLEIQYGVSRMPLADGPFFVPAIE